MVESVTTGRGVPPPMNIQRTTLNLLRFSLDLLFPDICRCCGCLVEESPLVRGICRECLLEVEYLETNVCCRCGTPFPRGVLGGHHCSACLKKPPSYDRAVSIAVYDKTVRKLLRNLKYGADTRTTPALRTISAPFLQAESCNYDLIIPVPLSRSRLRQRGLNQSLVLARILFADSRRLIRPTVLRRVRNTVPQTGLGGEERRRNLKGAFQVYDMKAVSGKHIVLVDDVYTTGTTVEECSRTLKIGGAARVEVVTFARVLFGK